MKVKTKLTIAKKAIARAPKKYVRVRVTEDKTSKTVEHPGGITEMVCGVGKFKDVTPHDLRLLVRKIVRTALAQKYTHLALDLHTATFPKRDATYTDEWVASAVAENLILASYEFSDYKSKKDEVHALSEVLICGEMKKDAEAAFKRGEIKAQYANVCRDIANTSGGDMTPALLAKRAKEAVRGTTAKVKVLDKKQIEALKMGMLLGVARGSRLGPRFIVMEYWGLGKPRAPSGKRVAKGSKRRANDHENDPIIFVGKGITFDTGGLNIKPGDAMLDMHLDMSGGAAVIAAVACAARLKLKKNIIGLIPAAENSVSDESVRPGDILRSMSGKTVDVLNTDAEGRLVLGDALTYAKRYDPRLVVDVATLTGAALIALGDDTSAVLSPDEKLSWQLTEWGRESGDLVWPLPLWNVHKRYMKGRFGDVANLRTEGNGRYAGTSTGAGFLWYFADSYNKGCKWAHIDMAPRMTSNPLDNMAKGASGEPVRLLLKIAESY